MSYNANDFDTRFGLAKEWKDKITKATGKEIISTIQDAEGIGPGNFLDIIVVAPCTGNTLAKNWQMPLLIHQYVWLLRPI